MNEAENQVKPNEEEAFALDLKDFEDAEALEDQDASLEDTKQPTEEEVSTPTEPKEEETQELDYAPLLEKLSKDIKYLDEEVKISSIDEGKTLIQKGLNHDRLKEKLDQIESSEELTYIRDKAKESGMTTTEYIKALKDYEIQQEKQKEEEELNEMIESGVAENIAKKVIETNRIAKELQRKEAEQKEREAQAAIKAKKDAENEEFLKAYPDIKINDIPKEVFIDAEKSNLLTAYTKYQNQELKKELELLKKNQENKETSPIKGTTEHGGVVIEKQDDFLKGLGL